MISEAGDDRRGGRLLLWGLALSIAIHALVAMLSSWLWLVKLPIFTAKPPERETVIASTAVRIEPRPVPQPRTHAQPHAAPRPAARPHELARQAPRAQPQPTPRQVARNEPSSLQQQIAQQEQTFSQELARLRASNNPLSIAANPRESPAAYRRTYFDVAGHRDFDAVQVQLIPIRHWLTSTTICYYARYVAQYTHGGSEEGTIPWPVCYPIGDDKIANPSFVHDIPVPVPPPNYVLPPGTYLTPLLARIYAKRANR